MDDDEKQVILSRILERKKRDDLPGLMKANAEGNLDEVWFLAVCTRLLTVFLSLFLLVSCFLHST